MVKRKIPSPGRESNPRTPIAGRGGEQKKIPSLPLPGIEPENKTGNRGVKGVTGFRRTVIVLYPLNVLTYKSKF
jgi:hypothetical protein